MQNNKQKLSKIRAGVGPGGGTPPPLPRNKMDLSSIPWNRRL